MPTQKQIDYYLDLCFQTSTEPEDGYEKWGAQRMFRKICELRSLKEKQEQEIEDEPGGVLPERGEDVEEEPVLTNDTALLMENEKSPMEIDYTPEGYDPKAAREALKRMMEEHLNDELP